MVKPDYSTWYTKQAAADAIGVSTKKIEQLAKTKQIQQGAWTRPTGGPKLAVYSPNDVNRLARASQPRAFVVPPANGGHIDGAALVVASPALPPIDGAALLRAMLQTVQKASQSSEKVFLTILEAADLTGLSKTYIRRECREGRLPAVQDGQVWKIRRTTLTAL
jgi:excisionase family DNA binding protein